MTTIIGTAGWSIPGRLAQQFPSEGSGLERYAAQFDGVEINSSFYRPHRATTWRRWADSVPDRFRFAVKMPKAISHERRLVKCEELAARFVEDLSPLGGKLAVLLLQLPPSLEYDAETFTRFIGLVQS